MKHLENLSISRKISIACSVLFLLMLNGAAVGYFNTLRIERMSDERQRAERVASTAGEASARIGDAEAAFAGYLLIGDEADVERYAAAHRSAAEALARLAALAAAEGGADGRLIELRDLLDRWMRQTAEPLIEAARRGAPVEAAAVAEGRALLQRLRGELDAVVAGRQGRLAERQAALAGAFTLTYWVAGLGALAALLFAAAAALLLSRGIVRPVLAITGRMRGLADGDKDSPIPGSRRGDEIGEMARAVTFFRDGLIEAERLAAEQAATQEARTRRAEFLGERARGFDAEVTAILGEVGRSTDDLARTAAAMTTISERTTRQAGAASAAAEQASANVAGVAAAAGQLSASIGEISSQIHQSASVSAQAADKAEATHHRVRDLAAAADRIGAVVSLIQDIAAQTNLLALNATIEAARAGEAGKGFAVVAGEVKSLANETARATGEIAEQVGAIQAETGQAVASIEEISGTVEEIRRIAGAIAGAIEQQNSSTRDIAANVRQAADGTAEVSGAIAEVGGASGETGAAAGQVLQASQSLAARAHALTAKVEAFLADVEAA